MTGTAVVLRSRALNWYAEVTWSHLHGPEDENILSEPLMINNYVERGSTKGRAKPTTMYHHNRGLFTIRLICFHRGQIKNSFYDVQKCTNSIQKCSTHVSMCIRMEDLFYTSYVDTRVSHAIHDWW